MLWCIGPTMDMNPIAYGNNIMAYIEGLVQERRNSSALAMELRLSCTDPLI